MIKNIAFEGGGVLGIAYSGAWLELEKRYLVKGLEKVSGVSAGGIFATLASLKFTAKEIFDIASATDFKSFEDGNIFDKTRLFYFYGLHPGRVFLKWIQDVIAKKLNPNATFADFHNAGYLDLHIFATNLNTNSRVRFCYETTPDELVCNAVRASMSIPGFFEAFEIKGQIYVDGGTSFNYPLTAFDGNCENLETLGLHLGLNEPPTTDNGLKFGEPKQYAIALFNADRNSQNVNLSTRKEDCARTVFIDDCGISATNFGLTFNDKAKLFEAGRKGVIDKFK